MHFWAFLEQSYGKEKMKPKCKQFSGNSTGRKNPDFSDRQTAGRTAHCSTSVNAVTEINGTVNTSKSNLNAHAKMTSAVECPEKTRCRELALSSSFYRTIYSEIEEVGWEHLVKLGKDLSFLSFRVIDEKERVHVMEIAMDKTYPKYPPSVTAEVPYIFDLEWSIKSRLKDVVLQFQQHLEKLQEFWSTLDDIDRSLWVVDSTELHRSMLYRQINIGTDCSIKVLINANEPRSLPECRFLGSDQKVNSLRNKWRRNCKKWANNKRFPENLVNVLETQLPRRPDVEMNDQQIECGICYGQFLPIDEELGDKSGSRTDYTCDNNTCSKAFHSVCLWDWLRSITTTRQSFDVLFGNCPYCSDPIAVKISTKK